MHQNSDKKFHLNITMSAMIWDMLDCLQQIDNSKLPETRNSFNKEYGAPFEVQLGKHLETLSIHVLKINKLQLFGPPTS